MATKQRAAGSWESRHFGSCSINRSRLGWVVSLGHSEGITGPFQYLVPFETSDHPRRRPLAARLKRLLQGIITDLGDVRRVPGRELAELARPPRLGPRWRGRVRCYAPGPGNWNGRGKLCPVRSHSGLSYFALRTDRGWLVMLRSLWGSPCGSYMVPFDVVPFRGQKWDADFFIRPLRWHLSHMHGVRKIEFEELRQQLGWWDDACVDDKKAA